MTFLRIDYLYERCLYQLASAEEQQEFLALLRAPENEAYAAVLLSKAFRESKQTADISPSAANAILEAILRSEDKLHAAAAPVHRIHLLRTSWFRYVAVILLLFGIVVYFFRNDKKKSAEIVQDKPANSQNDILPGGQRATLTLADGSTILLDSAGNGLLSKQNGASIEKLGIGQIVYHPAKAANYKTLYNTMTTPKGGQYQLTLPDGTGVWLNAASSITYPTMFVGNAREVTITGEAYFEVVKDKTKPFTVKTVKDKITVLGTSFNVNSYADEPVSKTTLLRGSVQINDKILRPGEAYVNGKVIKTDINQDIAWKNGVFNFQDKKLIEVMRQLSRWYDIEVRYEKGVPDMEFIGKMGRDLSLGQVLKALKNSEVNFVFEGKRKLIVKS